MGFLIDGKEDRATRLNNAIEGKRTSLQDSVAAKVMDDTEAEKAFRDYQDAVWDAVHAIYDGHVERPRFDWKEQI